MKPINKLGIVLGAICLVLIVFAGLQAHDYNALEKPVVTQQQLKQKLAKSEPIPKSVVAQAPKPKPQTTVLVNTGPGNSTVFAISAAFVSYISMLKYKRTHSV